MQKLSQIRSSLILAALSVCFLPVISGAQSAAAAGTLNGTVTDPQAMAVPGARVTIRSADSTFARTVVTDEAGAFIAPLLPPGAYTVEVQAPGFVLKRPARVTLGVGASVQVDVRLGLAATSQQVRVSARGATVEGNTLPPAVNKQEALGSNSIAGLTVTYLPNRDRDFSQFGQLAAGVEPSRSGSGLVVAGQRANASTTAIDGADFDDPLQGGRRGASDDALFFPQTVVREFQIVHAGASADVGGTNAGFVNVATKSGSNKLHGEGFYIGRPSALASADAFGHSVDNTRNEFGGSLGGPIKRNRAFFYVGGEQDLLDDPYWTDFAAQAPGAMVPGSLATLEQQVVGTNHPTALFGRTDIILNSANTLNLEFNFNRIRATGIDADGSTRSLATASHASSLSGQSVWWRGNLTTLLSPRTVNEFLAQWSSDRRDLMPNSFSPEIVINGFGVLGGSGLDPQRYTSGSFRAGDDLVVTKGGALLHVGFDAADNPGRQEQEANLNGRFDFNSLADYSADQPRRYQQTFLAVTPEEARYDGEVREVGAYISSRAPLAKALTLTAGLRWDGQYNPQPNHPNAAVAQTTRIPNDLSEWQPRLGLAWTPATKTVVRVSTGLYDAFTPAALFQRVFTDNGLETVTADSYFDPEILRLVASTGLQLQALTAPPASLTTPVALVVGIAPDFRNPRSFQAAASLEQQFGKLDLSAGYLRDSTWNLQRRLNRNLDPPTIDSAGMPIFPEARPDPAIGELLINESSAHSTYDGVLLTANIQVSRRTQIAANYTLSRTIDDDDGLGPFGFDSALNPFDLAAERAHSSMDIRHNFNLSSVYNLPKGFKLNPIVVARSGVPFTPVIGFDTQNDADDLNDRAIIHGVVAGRNSMRQPSFFDLDIRFVKDITLPGEGHHLDLFMDVFNVTGASNRNFGPDAISLYGTPAAQVYTAGQPLFAPGVTRLGGPRQVQFTARIVAF